MKNKLEKLINKKMPKKDLFSKIEVEAKASAAVTPVKKTRKPLIISLSSVAATLVVAAVGVGVASNVIANSKNNSGFNNGGIAEYDPSKGETGETYGPAGGPDVPSHSTTTGTSEGVYPGGLTPGAPGYADVGGEYPEIAPGESAEGDADIENRPNQYVKQLTASELSDFDAFDDYVKLINGEKYNDDQTVNDSFKKVYDELRTQATGISTKNLFALNFTDKNDTPINNAYAELVVDGDKVFTARSDMFGNAYMYATTGLKESSEIKINYTYGGVSSTYNVTSYEVENYFKVKLDVEANNNKKIDLVFLIDTTGSMGDEMNYIRQELQNICSRIVESDFDLQIGFVLYKDIDDGSATYITKYNDLTSVFSSAQAFIDKQTAVGGGDYEEAIERGLESLNTDISWREDSTKVAFHIFDAPAHDERAQKVYNQYLKSAELGIKLVPVTCSGIDTKGELMAREEALFTGGRYTFLTNDSGIGGNHLEATTSQELVVEYFEDLIVRITKEYGLGQKLEKVPYEGNNNTTTEPEPTEIPEINADDMVGVE